MFAFCFQIINHLILTSLAIPIPAICVGLRNVPISVCIVESALAMASPVSSYPQNPPETEIGIEIESSSPCSHNLRPAVSAIDASPSAAATTTSTSSISHSNRNIYCDVFINHRGPDVKKTLASHLYHRLRLHGIRVFLDRPELNEGGNFSSKIDAAIRTASVHVAIFSRTYAASTSCLNELFLMLESKAPIVPVFYGVKPDDLSLSQGKDGVYAQDLCNLEITQTGEGKPRYDSTSIQTWRDALSRVAEIRGFDLDAYNGE